MIDVMNHGSLVLFAPDAEDRPNFWEWVIENVSEYQTWGGALVVEPRYSRGLASGLQAEGFEVKGD